MNFQVLCVIIAFISGSAMCYTGLNVQVAKKYQPELNGKGMAMRLLLFEFESLQNLILG